MKSVCSKAPKNCLGPVADGGLWRLFLVRLLVIDFFKSRRRCRDIRHHPPSAIGKGNHHPLRESAVSPIVKCAVRGAEGRPC